jgi:hypothetical protein
MTGRNTPPSIAAAGAIAQAAKTDRATHPHPFCKKAKAASKKKLPNPPHLFNISSLTATRRPKMPCPHCNQDRLIKAKGMCMACYMRERRRSHGSPSGRRANGQSLMELLQWPDRSWLPRILARIDSSGDGCHEWLGSRNNCGYGIATVADRNVLIHRLIHAIHGGDPMCQVVMHTCDNPACCNPAHLVGGTYQDNMRDMHEKGRRFGGRTGVHLKDRQKHPRAKPFMTPKGEFASMALAAEAYGVSYATMKNWNKKADNGFGFVEGVE